MPRPEPASSPQTASQRPVLLFGTAVLAAFLMVVWFVWSPDHDDPGSAATAHRAVPNGARDSRGHGSRPASDPSEAVAAGLQRSLTLPSIRVIDATTKRSLAGVDIRLFDDDDQTLGTLTTDHDGRAILPTDIPLAGLSARITGYRFGAADVGDATLPLWPIDYIDVRVSGASAALLDNYELQVSLEFDGKGYPLEWARLMRIATDQTFVTIRGGHGLLPRTLDGLARVVLHGRHRGNGHREEFDRALVSPDEHRVEFDASKYARPTGNWLRLTVHLPTHTRAYSVRLSLKYWFNGQWMTWRNALLWMTPGDEIFADDFSELLAATYRVTCEFMNSGLRGELRSRPFKVRGATIQTVKFRDSGGTIEVRFHGPHAKPFTAERIRLRNANHEDVRTLLRDIAPGIVRLTGVPPGSYWLRTNNWTLGVTFEPQTVQVRTGLTTIVTVRPSPAGILRVDTTAPANQVHLTDGDGQPLAGRYPLRAHRGSWSALLTRGHYGVRIGNGPLQSVVVGEGVTVVKPTR